VNCFVTLRKDTLFKNATNGESRESENTLNSMIVMGFEGTGQMGWVPFADTNDLIFN